jgi:hypothetical protein
MPHPDEPNPCGCRGPTIHIALWLDFDDRRSRLEQPRAQFGTREIHSNFARATQYSVRASQVLDHLCPGGLVVVCAVDSHAEAVVISDERLALSAFRAARTASERGLS